MFLEERFEVAAPREHVWKIIRDPQCMMPCIPGCRRIDMISDSFYKASLGIAVGPIKAEFDLDIELQDEEPPERMISVMRGEEGSRASQLQATNVVRLTEIDPHTTEVYYSSDVAITGRLGRFGLGVMRKTAGRLAAKFEQAFKAQIEQS